MNPKECAAEFARQRKPKGKASALYYVVPVAYSYGPHFPAAIIRGTRAFVNSDSYSSTTSRHMSTLRAALREAGFTLTPRDTDEMRALVANGGNHE